MVSCKMLRLTHMQNIPGTSYQDLEQDSKGFFSLVDLVKTCFKNMPKILLSLLSGL